MFLENGCTFYERQIVLFNIVLLRSTLAQNAQNAHQGDSGKDRQAIEIKSTQV